MELLAFGAGAGSMYLLAGLFFRSAVNNSIGDDNEDAKMGLLESIFWPVLIAGSCEVQ